MTLAQAHSKPLLFLKLLAHDIRWQILLALAKSDYRVNELVKLIKEPANLISYHLKSLRLRDIVTERRSSADSRDIYYSLNIEQFRKMYIEAGQVLHPALGAQPELEPNAVTYSPTSVLFLCTHNSARSQMAEALLRQLGGNRVEVYSAGSEPKSIHPLAIKVMSGRGIDLSGQRAKLMTEFTGQNFDYVITVCDKVREVCPIFPGSPEQIHWSFPDPAAIEGSLQSQQRGFEETARGLTTRIQYLLLMIDRDMKGN
jgi:protein-tyrosine-phosphatase